MRQKEFLEILEILEKSIPNNSPSNLLKNSFKRTPYTILMATLLSLRTKDENTAKVCKRLFVIANTPQQMIETPIEELEQIVKPTGMYRKKAKILQEVSQTLIDRFEATVPQSKVALLSIKGVGEKTANIVLNNAFGIPTIAVDTHLHRIPNMLGFIETKTAKETQKELSANLPKQYWSRLNFVIVSFGQTICLPRNPKCDLCPIVPYCHQIQK
jgi:endonuclease-3